eukprot:2792513-Alexandrium_andersonii.AAC.1
MDVLRRVYLREPQPSQQERRAEPWMRPGRHRKDRSLLQPHLLLHPQRAAVRGDLGESPVAAGGAERRGWLCHQRRRLGRARVQLVRLRRPVVFDAGVGLRLVPQQAAHLLGGLVAEVGPRVA